MNRSQVWCMCTCRHKHTIIPGFSCFHLVFLAMKKKCWRNRTNYKASSHSSIYSLMTRVSEYNAMHQLATRPLLKFLLSGSYLCFSTFTSTLRGKLSGWPWTWIWKDKHLYDSKEARRRKELNLLNAANVMWRIHFGGSLWADERIHF